MAKYAPTALDADGQFVVSAFRFQRLAIGMDFAPMAFMDEAETQRHAEANAYGRLNSDWPMKLENPNQITILKRYINRGLSVFFITILTGCATHLSERWNCYDAGPFSFSMPPSLKMTDVHGIDSYCSQFTNQDMVLIFDYGAYSGDPMNNLSKRKAYHSHIETIAGHNVQIVTLDADEASGNRFKHLAEASFLGIGLTMAAECRTESEYDDAVKIFRSVRFKKR